MLDGLGAVVADAAGLVEMAGSAAFAPKKAASTTAPSSEDALNLSDVFTRVYLARLCAAVVFSERGGVSAGGPFYQMLTLLATRCEHPCLLALAGSFGATTSKSGTSRRPKLLLALELANSPSIQACSGISQFSVWAHVTSLTEH